MTESAVADRCLSDVKLVEDSNPPLRPWRSWNVPPPEKRIEDSIPTLRPGQKWVEPFVPPPRPKGRMNAEEMARFKAKLIKSLESKPCPATSGESPPIDLKKALEKQTMDYATIALNHYNATTEGPRYELVETFSRAPLVGAGVWFHVSFTAKPSTDAGTDASPKHFFAEVAHLNGGETTVSCHILDLDSPDTVDGCRLCPRNFKMYHPKDGFEVGRTWR